MHRLCPVWGIDARATEQWAKNRTTEATKKEDELGARERASGERELISSLRPASISDRFAMPDRPTENTLEDEIKSENLTRRLARG